MLARTDSVPVNVLIPFIAPLSPFRSAAVKLADRRMMIAEACLALTGRGMAPGGG